MPELHTNRLQSVFTGIKCTIRTDLARFFRYWSKIVNLTHPHLYLALPTGVTPSEFRRDIWHQKTRVRDCSRDPSFSRFDTIPASD